MSFSDPEISPRARLVLVMICLCLGGSLMTGAHYYAVDLPARQAIPAPENSAASCQECYAWCAAEHPDADGCTYTCLVYNCPQGSGADQIQKNRNPARGFTGTPCSCTRSRRA